MQPRPDGNALFRQHFRRFFAVFPRQEGHRSRLMCPGKHPEALLDKPPDAALEALLLLPENRIRAHPFQVYQPLGQGGAARHVQRPRLQPLRQLLRHLLRDGLGARSAIQEWLSIAPAQEQPRAPRAEKSNGSVPADWAASRMKGTPRWRHRAAISPTGRI